MSGPALDRQERKPIPKESPATRSKRPHLLDPTDLGRKDSKQSPRKGGDHPFGSIHDSLSRPILPTLHRHVPVHSLAGAHATAGTPSCGEFSGPARPNRDQSTSTYPGTPSPEQLEHASPCGRSREALTRCQLVAQVTCSTPSPSAKHVAAPPHVRSRTAKTGTSHEIRTHGRRRGS